MTITGINWDTFICYRGESSGSKAGIEIGDEIYKTIQNQEGFGNVFYAEGSGIPYEFKRHADPIIRNVRKFIVILTTQFFSGFFLDGNTEDEFTINPESVTALELNLAFKYKCEIYPVLSGEFSWSLVDTKTMSRLKSLYKEQFSTLSERASVYQWHQNGNSAEDLIHYFSEVGVYAIRNQMREFSLLGEVTREYDKDITTYATKHNSKPVRDWLKDILNDQTEIENVKYAAFYLLQIMCRQNKDYTEMKNLFDQYPSFSNHESFSHLRFLYQISNVQDLDNDKLLEQTETHACNFPENAGYIHLFADCFANICEQSTEAERETIIDRWGLKALKAVDAAIRLDEPYAKFHCTKARILMFLHRYNEAIRQINLAIDKEDSNRVDYYIRLSDYQHYKTMIRVEQRFDEWNHGGKV